MLAFLDSPVSFHGSSVTGQTPGIERARKIIRCHTAISTTDLVRLYKHRQINEDFSRACAGFRETRDPSVSRPFEPGFVRDRGMVRRFRSPGPAETTFRGFELRDG